MFLLQSVWKQAQFPFLQKFQEILKNYSGEVRQVNSSELV
jgi:hypothetical protein